MKELAEAIEAPRPVTPHPAGKPGKVVFAGLTLNAETADAISSLAREMGIAPRALIVDVVERWAWHEEWARREAESREERGER